MNRAKSKRIAIALAVASTAAMLTGCGGSSPGNGIGGTSSGLVGSCIPITGLQNQNYGSGVNPQLMQNAFTFSGQGIRVNTASVVGGILPPIGASPCEGQNNGQVVTTGSVPFAPEQLAVLGSYDGDFTMTVTNYIPTQQGYYGGAVGMGCTETGRASVTGKMRISPQTQDEIVRLVMSGAIPVSGYNGMSGYNPYSGVPGYQTNPFGASSFNNPLYGQPYANAAMPQICVSNVAFDMGYLRTSLFGVAYVYLNNSSHGIKLRF